MKYAPIAYFAFKRPEHTLRSLTALSECALAPESALYIFCDGPKREEDRINVEKVREIVASRRWCGDVNIIAKEHNVGLAGSVIDGVSKLCAEFGRVIVIEDDLLVARGFLDYMNRALNRYADCPQVMQIAGHRFPFYRANDDGRAFFMPIINSWGWSTWDRAWSMFDPQASGWERLQRDRALRRRFDLGGAYPFSKMLFDQMSGKVDSWAIRWWWSFFRHGGLCLYPARSLVTNTGFGEDATHTTDTRRHHDDIDWDVEREACDLPGRIVESREDFGLLKRYLRSVSPQQGILARLLRHMKRKICPEVVEEQQSIGPGSR